MEATPSVYAARADIVPHLDGADISVTLHQRGGEATPVQVGLDILPATVDPGNLTNPDPVSLIPAGALPLASQRIDGGQLGHDGTIAVHAAFSLTNADLWAPQSPALYVLQVQVFWQERLVDQIFETFGLRRIAVDATSPRLLLNGDPVAYAGVALHDERVYPAVKGQPRGGPVITPDDILILLDKANATNIQLIRADHHPANPLLLMLADRLGYAIWEEIPLYHYTPATFAIAMDRGIPQQMLSEMDLRDMNHPSVLFHGLANESTGGIEREQALATLHNLDRALDGTRLTGQAAYGSEPDDRTSRPLDVAGLTTYYGVFYGPDPGPGRRGKRPRPCDFLATSPTRSSSPWPYPRRSCWGSSSLGRGHDGWCAPDAPGERASGRCLDTGGADRRRLDRLWPGPGQRLCARGDPLLVLGRHLELAAGSHLHGRRDRTAATLRQPDTGAPTPAVGLVPRYPCCRSPGRRVRRAGRRIDRRPGGGLLQPVAVRGACGGRGTRPDTITANHRAQP